MLSGTITLNGISDADLITILQQKQDGPYFKFDPQLLQAATSQAAGQTAGQPGAVTQVYNNVVLAWQHELGLKAIQSILRQITTAGSH